MITLDKLHPCDILFFNGSSLIDRAIQVCSDSYHNHVAMVAPNNLIAGAGIDGFKARSIQDTIGDTDIYVDCVRFVGDPSRMIETQLGSAEYPLQPVLDSLNKMIAEGNMYDYPAILLLAGICAIRRLINANTSEQIVIDKAFLQAEVLIENSQYYQIAENIVSKGKTPAVCSASIFRVLENADNGKYRPMIPPNSMNGMYNSLPIYTSEFFTKMKELWKDENGIPFQFVTPSDLYLSPNIGLSLGRLQYGNLQV
jgi:hypothetical protein